MKFFFLPSCLETKSWQTNQFLLHSSQRIPPKKFLPENFSQKNPPKKFLQKILNKIQKCSKQIFKQFLRFWKNPIPYIALRGRKPFRICFSIDETIVAFWNKIFLSFFFRHFWKIISISIFVGQGICKVVEAELFLVCNMYEGKGRISSCQNCVKHNFNKFQENGILLP